MYELKESGCIPFELTKEEYEKCAKFVRQMRMSDLKRSLEKAIETCGVDAVAEMIKSLNIL